MSEEQKDEEREKFFVELAAHMPIVQAVGYVGDMLARNEDAIRSALEFGTRSVGKVYAPMSMSLIIKVLELAVELIEEHKRVMATYQPDTSNYIAGPETIQ